MSQKLQLLTQLISNKRNNIIAIFDTGYYTISRIDVISSFFNHIAGSCFNVVIAAIINLAI